MVTRVAERVMLDTNVLLAATDEGRPDHRAALAVVNDWPGRGTVLYASGQIYREYLAVATRPVAQNGLGMKPGAALGNVAAFRSRARLLAEDSKVADHLATLVAETGCGGKQVHDANVAATMLAHGVQALVTINVPDFARFTGHIQVIGLTARAGGPPEPPEPPEPPGPPGAAG
jgi:predicted nucleic acid-binding protein